MAKQEFGNETFNIPKLALESSRGMPLPETEEEWVGHIDQAHDTGISRRRRYEYQWVLNLSYYMGYTNLLFNTQTWQIEIPRDASPTDISINRLGSFIESRIAKLTKNRPIPRVIPNTTDMLDKRAAVYSDQVLKHLWRVIDFEDEMDRVIFMMLVYGTSFVETVWDPFAGDTLLSEKTNDDGDLLLTDDGDIDVEKIFMGEVASGSVSPFSLVAANHELPSVKDQEWIIKRSHLSVAEIEKRWPKLRGEINPNKEHNNKTDYEKIVSRLSSPIFQTLGQEQVGAKDAINSEVLVKTFYMKPNIYFEKGVWAVVVQGQLAMIDKFPNDFGKNIYPIVRFAEKETGHQFFPQATIERLIPIQKAFNNLRGQKLRNAELMANLKWMLPKGSGVSEDSLTDEEGEVVEYNSSLPEPHPAQISPMPNYVQQLANDLILDMRDVGGQRENSSSPSPNVVASVAMQTAAELADEQLAPILNRVRRSMTRVSNQQLMLVNQEWIEARKVKVIGDAGKTAIEFLSAVDLRNSTDVHIEIESMFPELRGAKRQFLMDLWDRRIVEDKQKLLQSLRFGDFDLLLEEREKLAEAIHLDIAALKKGKAPEFNPFSNHIEYSQTLLKFMNTPEFLRLIPERKQQFQQVLEQHMVAIQQQMPQEPQAQTNQAAVGTPFGAQRTVGSPGAAA